MTLWAAQLVWSGRLVNRWPPIGDPCRLRVKGAPAARQARALGGASAVLARPPFSAQPIDHARPPGHRASSWRLILGEPVPLPPDRPAARRASRAASGRRSDRASSPLDPHRADLGLAASRGTAQSGPCDHLLMSEPLPVDVRPDVLDWMTAIGTVGATMIAALAIAYQVHDHRRRRNAELISSWIVTGEEEPIEIVMHNAGTTPAYEVVARARFQGRTGAVATATTLQPGSAHVLRPGGTTLITRMRSDQEARKSCSAITLDAPGVGTREASCGAYDGVTSSVTNTWPRARKPERATPNSNRDTSTARSAPDVPSACPCEKATAGTGGHSRGEPSAPDAQAAPAQSNVTASSAFAGQEPRGQAIGLVS